MNRIHLAFGHPADAASFAHYVEEAARDAQCDWDDEREDDLWLRIDVDLACRPDPDGHGRVLYWPLSWDGTVTADIVE